MFKRCRYQPQLLQNRNTAFWKELRAAHNSKIHCIFRSYKQYGQLEQINNPVGYLESYSLYKFSNLTIKKQSIEDGNKIQYKRIRISLQKINRGDFRYKAILL